MKKTNLSSIVRRGLLLLTILTIGVAQLWAQSTTYTSSNMSNIGFSNAGACKVVISSTQYDGWKLGSNGNSGSMHFNIPVGTTHLHLHFAGWNNDGASRTLSVSTSVGKFVSGNTTTKSVSLTNDSGVKSSSPFTLATPANASTSYYIDLEMTGVSSAATITIATSSNRAVLWGINALAAASTYTVTYNGNGKTSGSVPTDATAYSSGATVTVKGNTGSLAKTGYTFGGWNTNAAGTGTTYAAGSGTFTITANTTLYAKWTANTISLTLNKNNSDASGSANGSASVKYDATSLTSISHATRTGYSIEGYYAEAGCTNKVLSNTGALVNYTGYVVSSKWARTTTPTTLYANWTLNSYTLTWNLNGGTVTVAGTGAAVNATGSPSSSVNYGASITAPTVTKEGNTFAGWNTTPASTMPASNTTYTAQWTPNQYTVTWKSNGGVARTDNNVNHGTSLTAPTISPLPCGDKLVGWTDAINGEYIYGTSTLYEGATPAITITDNKVFYAVFADYVTP